MGATDPSKEQRGQLKTVGMSIDKNSVHTVQIAMKSKNRNNFSLNTENILMAFGYILCSYNTLFVRFLAFCFLS